MVSADVHNVHHCTPARKAVAIHSCEQSLCKGFEELVRFLPYAWWWLINSSSSGNTKQKQTMRPVGQLRIVIPSS